MELYGLTIHELQEKLRKGEISSQEITASVFRRIDAVEQSVRSYITLMKDSALEEANRADRLIKKGQAGPLTGIPIALKDVLVHKGG